MFTKQLMLIAATLSLILSAAVSADSALLSEVEIEDLRFMREEEKLARDVYAELYEYYKEAGVELIVLANITASEQRHMDAMLNLLDQYGIDDPAAGLEPGDFDNTVLSALYGNLVSDSAAIEPILGEPASGGKVSPEAALYVGAWIEERDMIDILHAIANTGRADIVGIYTKLLCGSRSHLRAFVKLIGIDDYQPQLLHSALDADAGMDPTETLEFWLGDESDLICL